MEYTFMDYYKNKVKLSFADEPFGKNPGNVWVISVYDGKWLLTKHKTRGFEFPGGNVEAGEVAVDAAVREVLEETGGIVKELHYVAQYKVLGKADTIVKNVYFAIIDRLEDQPTYYETNGPLLLEKLPADIRRNRRFSFMMKDDVLPLCVEAIQKQFSITLT